MATTLWPTAVGPPPSQSLVPWLAPLSEAERIYAHQISGTSYAPKTITPTGYSAKTISPVMYDPTQISSPTEDLFNLGPSEFEGIRLDPQTRSAQLAMLADMMRSFQSGGFNPAERARIEAVLLTQRQAQAAGAQGAWQQAERRGLGNSAYALASSLFSSQKAAETASQQAMQVGLAADERRNQLRGDIAGLSGSIHAQDYKEQADRAAAIDAINRFNIDNKQQWAARAANRELTVRTQNQQATNQARQFNAGQRQSASAFNAGEQNTAARFNAGQTQAAASFNAGAQNEASRFAAQSAFEAARFNSQQTFDAERYNSQQAWTTQARNSEIDQFNQTQAYNDAWARYQAEWKAADFWTQNPWAAPDQGPPGTVKPPNQPHLPVGPPHPGGSPRTYVP